MASLREATREPSTNQRNVRNARDLQSNASIDSDSAPGVHVETSRRRNTKSHHPFKQVAAHPNKADWSRIKNPPSDDHDQAINFDELLYSTKNEDRTSDVHLNEGRAEKIAGARASSSVDAIGKRGSFSKRTFGDSSQRIWKPMLGDPNAAPILSESQQDTASPLSRLPKYDLAEVGNRSLLLTPMGNAPHHRLSLIHLNAPSYSPALDLKKVAQSLKDRKKVGTKNAVRESVGSEFSDHGHLATELRVSRTSSEEKVPSNRENLVRNSDLKLSNSKKSGIDIRHSTWSKIGYSNQNSRLMEHDDFSRNVPSILDIHVQNEEDRGAAALRLEEQSKVLESKPVLQSRFSSAEQQSDSGLAEPKLMGPDRRSRSAPIAENPVLSLRSPQYLRQVADFVQRNGVVPNFNCPPSYWEFCAFAHTSNSVTPLDRLQSASANANYRDHQASSDESGVDNSSHDIYDENYSTDDEEYVTTDSSSEEFIDPASSTGRGTFISPLLVNSKKVSTSRSTNSDHGISGILKNQLGANENEGKQVDALDEDSTVSHDPNNVSQSPTSSSAAYISRPSSAVDVQSSDRFESMANNNKISENENEHLHATASLFNTTEERYLQAPKNSGFTSNIFKSAASSPTSVDVFPTLLGEEMHSIIDPSLAEPHTTNTSYVSDSTSLHKVLMLRSMTTTGLRQPVLVLYTYALDRQATYVLSLLTRDARVNSTGLSKMILKFSPEPNVEGCYVRPVNGSSGGLFRGTCYGYSGTYYPVIFQWSYHLTPLESKTIFYHGSLPEIEFQLPPGSESTNYEVFVTIKIFDGKGVSKTLPTKTVLVPPRHNSGDGVVAIFKEISKMDSYNPCLELEKIRALTSELNSIDNSVISQTVFDNILTILFYRESCMDSLETITEDPNDVIADNSVIESFYRVNMLKSCARDHLAEITCASLIRDEMEILLVETTLTIILDTPDFISSKTFFRVVDAMWRIQKQHMQLWDYRTEIRSEVAKHYFALVSSLLDKQSELYDLPAVSVDTTNQLIWSLMRVMDKEVRSRFLEESPLKYSTSTLEFTGFLSESDSFTNSQVQWMFTISGVDAETSIPVHSVLCLEHFKSPYMVTEGRGVDVSSHVLHLQLARSRLIWTNIQVRLQRSHFLTHSEEYDFRRPGTILPERLNVYKLEITPEHQHQPLHVQLQVTKVYDPDYPIAPIALICQDMQSLDTPLYEMRLQATQDTTEGVLFVPPGALPPATYVLVILDQNSYDNRWSRRMSLPSYSSLAGADYQISGWWSDCLLWNNIHWVTGQCTVLKSTWDAITCSCNSTLTVYGGVVYPILDEQDSMNVNELMLLQSYCALYFILFLFIVYIVLAVSLTTSERINVNRQNVWLRENDPSHEHAYLLTIKTGTQKHAGTSAKVFTILHGTASMSDTRELQSSITDHIFVRGSVCSFIITTKQALGNILKVQLWHNNQGDEFKRAQNCSSTNSSHTETTANLDDSTYGSSQDFSGSTTNPSSTSSRYSSRIDIAIHPPSHASTSTSDANLDRISLAPSISSKSGDTVDHASAHYTSSSTHSLHENSDSKPCEEESQKINRNSKSNSEDPDSTCCSSYPSCGDAAAWFVCEVRVSELTTGAVFDFPCYRWLSVTENDAKVEHEISLETATTFWQDVEHFFPQYANENVVWTSLCSMSHSVRFYRLQRLTICLIVCLGLGTASLSTVKRINTSHTMMTPDLHIEPLLYAFMLSPLLMPVQWLLEILFKASNRLEEKEASFLSARKTIDALTPPSGKMPRCTQSTQLSASSSTLENGSRSQSSKSVSSLLDVLDSNSQEWKNMLKWADNFTVETEHEDDVLFQNLLRNRKIPNNSSISLHGSTQKVSAREEDKVDFTDHITDGKTNVSQENIHVVDENTCAGGDTPVQNPSPAAADDVHTPAGIDHDDTDVTSLLEEMSSSVWRRSLQILSWTVCILCVAACGVTLLIKGADMPVDYSTLWLQIIYATLCTSVIVIQPLIVVMYTISRVMVYRWCQGCRGSISFFMTFSLEQSILIWRHYRTAFLRNQSTESCGRCSNCLQRNLEEARGRKSTTENGHSGRASTSEYEVPDAHDGSSNDDSEEKLRLLSRARELRFARPPPETVLLKCRQRRLKRQTIVNFLSATIRYLSFLCLLIVIMNHNFVKEKNQVNSALKKSVLNGTCLVEIDEYYKKFTDIRNKDDWWTWAESELMALNFNKDEDFSTEHLFCDTNGIIIGNPRMRLYSVAATECSASNYMMTANESIISKLGIVDCFLEYRDPVDHLSNFLGVTTDKKYEWDAHYLAVLHGQFSHYSYTKHEHFLPQNEFGAFVFLLTLRAFGWLATESSRAIVTEFTIYHPAYDLYSTINYVAEFPSSSGAAVEISVASTNIQRYQTPGAYPTIFAECLLLPIAMFLLIKSVLYLYNCRFKVWKSFWGFLDLLLTFLLWDYIVCLMLRVQIAEDLMWQLKVSYFQKFVNLKGVMTWDSTITSILGFVIFVHIIRCLWLFSFFTRFRRLGLIFAAAIPDVLYITLVLLILIFSFVNMCFIWLNPISSDFYSAKQSFFTVFSLSARINAADVSVDDYPSGSVLFSNIYKSAIAILIVMFSRAYYFSAFSNAVKTFAYQRKPVEISLKDVFHFIVTELQRVIPFVKKKEQEPFKIANESIPPTLYISELDGQLDRVLDTMDSICSERGINLDQSDSVDDASSSFDSYSYREGIRENFTRNSFYSSGRKTYSDSETFPMIHVDGMTDVPSCRTETRAARKLAAGIRILTSSEAVHADSFTLPRQVVCDRDSEHLKKFLLDVRSLSVGNLTGTPFSKYGKHVHKIKSNEKKAISSISSVYEESCRHSSSSSTECRICRNLKKTETLGLDGTSDVENEMDFLGINE